MHGTEIVSEREKNKGKLVERKRVSPKFELEINEEVLVVLISFKYSTMDDGLKEHVKITVGEGLKTFCAMKMMFIIMNISFAVNGELLKE